MSPEIVIHLLIILIMVGVLIYVFRISKMFFIVGLLILVLMVLLIPEILIPLELWEYLLNK